MCPVPSALSLPPRTSDYKLLRGISPYVSTDLRILLSHRSNRFECLLRILSRRRCCGHGHRFRSHRSTAYGRGGGVGRGLGVGANLGVGVGLAVAVAVALAVAVAVAVAVGVGVGLPPPTKLNLPTRVRQTPLWAYWLTW